MRHHTRLDEALGSLFDPEMPCRILGTGRTAVVEELRTRDGRVMALKRFNDLGMTLKQTLITEDLRQYESVGIRLDGLPGIVRPKAFVILQGSEYHSIPMDPYWEAKARLREMAKSGTEARIAAVVMPVVEGCRLGGESELPPADRKAVCQQAVVTLQAMHSRGLVHRNLKPANIMYDPETKKTTLVDFGSSAKISNGSKLPFLSDRCGADIYRHPSMNMPDEMRLYGPEVDLHSFAMTGLKLSRGRKRSGDQLLRDLLVARSDFSAAHYLTEKRAFKEHREKNPNGTYFRNLLVFAAQEFGFISARRAQCDLDAGDLELSFIEAAFEVAMRKPDFSQATRNARFAEYYAGLAELQTHPYFE